MGFVRDEVSSTAPRSLIWTAALTWLSLALFYGSAVAITTRSERTGHWTKRVGAITSYAILGGTRDFSLSGLRPAGHAEFGVGLWPKEFCSWRRDAFLGKGRWRGDAPMIVPPPL